LTGDKTEHGRGGQRCHTANFPLALRTVKGTDEVKSRAMAAGGGCRRAIAPPRSVTASVPARTGALGTKDLRARRPGASPRRGRAAAGDARHVRRNQHEQLDRRGHCPKKPVAARGSEKTTASGIASRLGRGRPEADCRLHACVSPWCREGGSWGNAIKIGMAFDTASTCNGPTFGLPTAHRPPSIAPKQASAEKARGSGTALRRAALSAQSKF